MKTQKLLLALILLYSTGNFASECEDVGKALSGIDPQAVYQQYPVEKPSFKIRSIRPERVLDWDFVQVYKEIFLNENFEFGLAYNRVSGLYLEERGSYFIARGHQKIVAAMEIGRENGDWSYLRKFIALGNWKVIHRVPANAVTMPARTYRGRLRNWREF